MTDFIADRFLPSGSSWLDLATGAIVHLRFSAAGSTRRQFAWSERCAALARLRHPLINSLVDYGVADEGRVFEAYETWSPLRASGLPATRLLRHAARFLEAQGVPLSSAAAGKTMRMIEKGGSPRGRPLGIVLQPRRTLDALAETLREAAPGGVTAIAVRGARGSGVRTTALLAARVARLEGYVPLSARVLRGRPWLAEGLSGRHVALFLDGSMGRLDPAARAGIARFVTTLGVTSARRHVLITFGRDASSGAVLHMDQMGVTAMHAMVHTDRECGPSLDALLKEARAADGNPGNLIQRLRGLTIEPRASRFDLVREASAVYLSAPPSPARPAPTPGRLGALLRAAPDRAGRLASSGRHAAAGRLLARAGRVLDGRADQAGAARCALQWGWILRDRGDTAAAITQFERARRLGGESIVSVHATIATGVAWSDDGRLMEAEALLRSARSAAELLGDTAGAIFGIITLARCVLWQGRAIEASAMLQPALTGAATTEVWALAARVHLAASDVSRAAAAASTALDRALASGSRRQVAIACRAAVVVRAAIGDRAGAREAAERGLEAAADAHLPLTALRIRAAWLHALRGADPDTIAPRLLARLRAALLRPMPTLLRRQIEAACDRFAARGGDPHASAARPMAQVEEWLELAQTAPDDRTALQRVVEALCTRLSATAAVIISSRPSGVVIARAGRPWNGEPLVAMRALASGVPVSSEAAPAECGAPIKYGAETIGAIACRWAAGAEVDPHQAGAACAAAALAAAPSLRSLADIAPPTEPDAIWEDLLGTSPSAAVLRGAILNASRAPFPVLIHGESGSGKELVARAIHRLGPRRHRRLCTINCAAISDELLEAELFGHTRGAFTGAVAERAGLFEEADGGTLFLDEVGELSARAQAKLLRVLQDGEVRRVGENMPRRVDTRIVAATNRRLELEVDAGRFRADLRFRLDVIRIGVPPLRDRATDIPALVHHFWKDVAAQVGSKATLAPETVAALSRYEWPGNVRELQNAVASLAVHGPRRGRITPDTLPVPGRPHDPAAAPASFEAAREEFERRFVRAALARAGGQRTRAAKALGVSRQGLAKMLRRLQIEAPEGNISGP